MSLTPRDASAAAERWVARAWSLHRGPAALLVGLWWLEAMASPSQWTIYSDVPLYEGYAEAMHGGEVPFRDFFFEYPPGAAGWIYLARLLPGTYAQGFSWLMLAAALGCLAMIGPLVPTERRRQALWLFALLPLALPILARTRLDAAATMLTMGGLLLIMRGHGRSGLAALGVAAITKLYPAVLIPIAVRWLWRRGERTAAIQGCAIAATIGLGASLPFLGEGFLDFIRFHLERPVQIESVPASILHPLPGTTVTGFPEPDGFRSQGLDGPQAAAVERAFQVLFAGCGAWLIAMAGRAAGPEHLLRIATAALLAFVVLGKVLSPQFLIWLAPFAAILWAHRERVAGSAMLAALALTGLGFPSRYGDLLHQRDGAILFVGLRNALLVVALLALMLTVSRPLGSSGSLRVDQRGDELST